MHRQKVDSGKAQPTAGQDGDSAELAGDKPTLESGDARYLRKRKLHMDSMFDSAADE